MLGSVIDVFARNRAGHSAERKYKAMAKSWRNRRFGRRYSLYFWLGFAAALLLVLSLHLNSRWSLIAGVMLGGTMVGWMLMPEALIPGHIFNWQMGAWGEQKTASELKRLVRDGWVVRHDVAWGDRANHDHIVAGPAVFLVNSRNTPDSRVEIEADGIRVTRLDDQSDSYVADRWVPAVAREAAALEGQLRRELGLGVAVYPVIALWADFPAGQQYVGKVSVVDGLKLTEWIKTRPTDLVNADKRRRVQDWVAQLRRA
jgi:hypothetical protein